ncbi:DNA polymerase III subunit epsilon [Antarcticibacterium flavum]|uniref:Excinuclease cho n=1 Tax=Antarcticibacterium flavum TaxID=2058175 RepID=A0A5B7X0G7_9FLAO|nr:MULTISPECIES: exonuclease domain-containing protein [Antarcticibacterium]MCM4159821.1 DNA polymerase III subunit epsilon [Antarcticibacterium sp. W02-3]QCY68827.1 DNA polymerase III subunit epsilon [Antarcticibacterium flavum]
MKDQLFAVVDVETTGGGMSGNRLTEICIVLLKGNKVLDKYTSLINPEKPIPSYITALTGIDNALVANAPRFHEVAKDIELMTRDAIFVAHNVNFDYNVLRNEFRELGFEFTRRKLCTVRLSRKLIPGLFSYSLGRLCDSINIPITSRHRAEGDTDATVILFQRLLGLDTNFEVMRSFLHARSREATLPPHLEAEQIFDLPDDPGIYLFKDNKHKVIYAGKAINIKKRVISHFYDKGTKEYKLGQETYHIDYETTGNELIALLLEAEKIKKHYPKFNRAQKRPGTVYQIISYTNQKGVIQLALGTTRTLNNSVGTFYNRLRAAEKLEQLCEDFNLCPRFCTLQSNVEVCSHYSIQNCEGVCEGKESISSYNKKVLAAIASLGEENSTYIIREKGRHFKEEAFVYIKEGRYMGYGFIDTDVSIATVEDLDPFLRIKEATYHTNKILSSYLRNGAHKNIVILEQPAASSSLKKVSGNWTDGLFALQ